MVEGGGLEQSEALGLRGNLFCHLCHDFTRDLRQLQTSSRMRRHTGVIVVVQVEVNHLRDFFQQRGHFSVPYGEAPWL